MRLVYHFFLEYKGADKISPQLIQDNNVIGQMNDGIYSLSTTIMSASVDERFIFCAKINDETTKAIEISAFDEVSESELKIFKDSILDIENLGYELENNSKKIQGKFFQRLVKEQIS